MKKVSRVVRSLAAMMAPLAVTTAERAATSYVPYRFDPGESWKTKAEGDPGGTRLDGKTWRLDFSKGAKWISLAPPDAALLGDVDRLRLKVRGTAEGHPVHLHLNTHRFDPRPGRHGRVFALWDPFADAMASLGLPTRTATVVNTIGETRDVETGAGGALRLRLRKGAPVYVLVE